MENIFTILKFVNVISTITVNWFDYVAYIIIPVVVMFCNIWLVNRNTNKQIKNQNEVAYRPRLKIINYENVVNDNKTNPNYGFYYSANPMFFDEEESSYEAYIKICLKNIGNGVATDICLYDLSTPKRCSRMFAESNKETQVSFSTFDIECSGKEVLGLKIKKNNSDNPLSTKNSIYLLLLCKGLDGNEYKSILCLYSRKTPNHGKNGKFLDETQVSFYNEGTVSFSNFINAEDIKYNYRKICDLIKKETEHIEKYNKH